MGTFFTTQAGAHEFHGRPADASDGINEWDVGYTWFLPSFPVSTCCYRDRDCDRIYDWVEADLAWAFRPYLVYDNDENLSKGSLVLYQATPVQPFWQGAEKLRVQITWLFLFRADRTHHGDSEKIKAVVESADPEKRLWKLAAVDFRDCDYPQCSGEFMDAEWTILKGRNHPGIRWKYSEKTGMYHHRLHVSKRKHGLYASKEQCECCEHAGFVEYCDGGWEGLPLLGISLRDNAETGAGGEGWDAQAVIDEYHSLTPYQKKYSGNIGEIKDMFPSISGVYPNRRFVFFPSPDGGDIYKSVGYLGRAWVNPTSPYWHGYRWGIWSGFDSQGVWKGWDHGFNNEWIWDAQNKCFCGGKGRSGMYGECCKAAGNSLHWCRLCHKTTCTYCADGVWSKLMELEVSAALPPTYCEWEEMIDEDGDGIPKMFDCDDLNPILGIDADQDGFCDEPVPFHLRDECILYCDRHRTGRARDHCVDQCTSDRPDNCIDHNHPACAELVSDLRSGTLDVDNLEKYDECRELFHNVAEDYYYGLYQPDTTGDGVGDKCEGRAIAGFTSVRHQTQWETSRQAEEAIPGGPVVSVWRTCPVPTLAIDLDTYLGTMGPDVTRPIVVEGCDCDPEMTETDCRQYFCINDHKFDQGENLFSFRWIPTDGCWGRKEDFVKARAQAGDFSEWRPGCGQGDRCRYKDARFSHPSPTRFSSRWSWTGHKKFEPPTLEESLCKYEPDPESDRIALENRNLRLRATHPVPVPGDDVDSDSWYASENKFTVWQGYITAGELDVPDQGECKTSYPWDLFQSFVVVLHDYPKKPQTMGPGPLIWQMVWDPVTHDVATIGIRGDVLQPVSFAPVTVSGAELPSKEELDGAVWTGAAVDAAITGIGDGFESVTVAYMGGQPGMGPAPAPAERGDLLLGFVEQPDNVWLYWSEVFGDGEIPALENPSLIYHEKGNRLLLVGDRRLVEEDEVHQNVVYSLSLEDGSVRETRPLTWLNGLSDYGTVTDQWNEKAYIVGGTRISEGGGYAAPGAEETVFEVWSYDLQNEGFRLIAGGEAGPAGRKRAVLAVDGVQRKLFIYGGKNAQGESLKDLWEMNGFTGAMTLIHEGMEGGAESRPVLALDRMSRRLWLIDGEGEEMRLTAHALDLQDPGWHVQTIYSLEDDIEPGVRRGQIRFGRPETVNYTVSPEVSYGSLFSASLVSQEPHLKLELRDSNGKKLNESRPEARESEYRPSVLWSAIPGETYQLVVSPGRMASQDEHPYFELQIEEVEETEEFIYTTGRKVRDMEISGDMAYLACKQGIEAVDVSDEANMTLTAIHDGVKKARSISALGRWLAVGRGPGLWSLVVMDGREPEDLQVVSGVKALGMGRDLATVGRTVYAAHGIFGIKIYNLENPGSPFLAGTFHIGGPALAVAEGKGRLYAGHMRLGLWQKRGVEIYDITGDPGSAPVKVGEVETTGTPVAMRVVGNKLLVAVMNRTNRVMQCFAGVSCMEPDGVEVYDITIADSPEFVASLEYEHAAGLFGKYSGSRVLTVKETGFRVVREVME